MAMNELANLKRLIAASLEANDMLSEYSKYAPIFNSKIMLQEIKKHIDEKNYLMKNQEYLNVGLLAAKSLDVDPIFFNYATTLHAVWSSVRNILGLVFQPPSSGDRKKAYDFYNLQGFDDNRIASHFRGINFNFPIEDNFSIKSQSIVVQWMANGIPQGNYYAEDNSNVSPDCLGIHYQQENISTGIISDRLQHKYKIQNDIIVLKSTAAAVQDTWSIKFHKNSGFWTSGGCYQYFNVRNKKQIIIYP